APGGGTNSMLAVAPVRRTASATVLNTGSDFFDCGPSHADPPRPGVTPPTNFDPYSRHWSVWKVPDLPVIPWQITLVLESTRMLMARSRAAVRSSWSGVPGRSVGTRRGRCCRQELELLDVI